VQLEAAYWKVASDIGKSHREIAHHVPHVVLLFPYADHHQQARFSMGRLLQAHLGDGDGAALRFRRLLSCESRDELDHRLRGVLRLTAASGARVDWGVLGRDVLWFFADTDRVRRNWAQDFYAPIKVSTESERGSDQSPNS
ncbi:MAG: type I-E CRISPR-associated protein Cse2/CasB, partial [Myxococcales bacterium]|nr:type I-E CRISPR-associated protein Cse2/CasB [Myxococcales bacterium]